jgi:hypothetical protein
VQIPQLGVSAPGADIPGEIVRSGGQDHWVVTMHTPPCRASPLLRCGGMNIGGWAPVRANAHPLPPIRPCP